MSQCFSVPVHHSPRLNANLSTWGLFQTPPPSSPNPRVMWLLARERTSSFSCGAFFSQRQEGLDESPVRLRYWNWSSCSVGVGWGRGRGGHHWSSVIENYRSKHLHLMDWSIDHRPRGVTSVSAALYLGLDTMKRDISVIMYNVWRGGRPRLPSKGHWRSFLSSHFSVFLFSKYGLRPGKPPPTETSKLICLCSQNGPIWFFVCLFFCC